MASARDEGCRDAGTQGRPALPDGTLAAAGGEEGAPHVAGTTGGCGTRRPRIQFRLQRSVANAVARTYQSKLDLLRKSCPP